MTILITGGAGFIGSNFIQTYIKTIDEKIINLDKLTYAGNLNNLVNLKGNKNHEFIRGDISDSDLIINLLDTFKPRAIINFAAESHVDRSIKDPKSFITTNIFGTFNLLNCSMNYFEKLSIEEKEKFRFLHISTDEVYGSLKPEDKPFKESNQYKPNSPYSASKASSDHLVRSYFHTFKLPVLTTNCSNNYGPFQFPEKLIPLTITNALKFKKLPIYGNGLQIRDWLYVEDHCNAIIKVLIDGEIGEVYNIGGNNEKTNIVVVKEICKILDKLKPISSDSKIKNYSDLIEFIDDRPGHDKRYAIDSNKIKKTLNWSPKETFETGILKTVKWYLNNPEWIENIINGDYLK